MPVVEGHGDIPMDLWRRRRAGEAAPLREDYLRRLREGGVRFQYLTVGGDMPVTMDGLGRPVVRALELVDDVLEEAEASDELLVVRAAEDLDRCVVEDRIGLVLHLEGCLPLQGLLAPLRSFYRLGVRSVQLVWNVHNEVADGVGEASPAGLSPSGREVVAEIERLGMVLDLAHLAEPGFSEVLELATGPVVVSHANAAALWPHKRNLTDEQIRAVAATGGLVGVCFVRAFLGEEPTLETALDHVDHLVEVAGIDHVGFGADYVEFALDEMLADMPPGSPPPDPAEWIYPEGLRRVETLPVFTAGLLGRGYSEADAAKILGGNNLRVLRAVL